MFPLKGQLRLVGSALGISVTKDSIICVDNFYNISIFSKETHIIDKALQLSKDIEPLHHFSKAASISHANYTIVLGFVSNSKGVVLTAKKEIAPVMQLTWQKLPISKAKFSFDDSLLATGGEDGRVLVYAESTKDLIFSLPPFPDTISTIAFSDDDELIFSACFGKHASVYSVVQSKEIAHFTTDSLIEDAFFYDDNKKLLCVTKEGDVLIYDIKENALISRMTLKNAWLTACHRIPGNDDFALVGGRDKILRIICLSDNALADSIQLEHTGITTMRFADNLLYLGYSDGAIEIVEINRARDEMLQTLEKNDLKGALALIQQKNVFLQTLKEYCTKLETLWKETLAKAIDLLAKDQIQEATDLVEPFMLDKNKKQEFDYYWQQKEAVAKFLDAIEAKKFVDAYRLVELNPYLKETIAYEQLENLWNKSFEVAKRLLFQAPQDNMAKVQDLLRPFVNVKSKKDSAMMLIRNSDKFVQADNIYKSKNFVEYFKLCERLPFLKDTLIYRSALLIGDQIMQRVNACENQNDFAKANEICKLLSSMVPFREVATQKAKILQIKQEFATACQNRKLAEAFKLAETHDILRSTEEYKNLYSTFKQCEKNALTFASAGNGKGALDNLRDYLHIEYWQDKIAAILKVAYLKEFALNAPNKEGALDNISWKETFQYYIERYGKDEELKKVAEEMGLTSVLNEIPFEGNAKGYLNQIIADSLLSIDNQPLHQHEEK
ncbi:MAG: WD40 repeat domain-containing protein [Helicobacter sp.]|nr:WD40 repeat domain-containing protein [Helicobacteraceae bacterium]MDY3113883.1 WD40 repeat domain-containing protein [Helicobacter sp.]